MSKDQYVVVSIVEGLVHAYGPYNDRGKCKREIAKMRKSDEIDYANDPRSVAFHTCKIINIEGMNNG